MAANQHDPRPPPEAALRGLAGIASAGKRGPAPVHLWNPAFCGDIDMRIAADGTWFYNGSPIGRAPLVQLFASILRKDEEKYVLVTPGEKVGIRVEDAPFVAIEMNVGAPHVAKSRETAQTIAFRTNVEDFVTVDADHPLRFERGASDGLKPYVRIRGDLWALVKRALFYDLVALGVTEPWREVPWFGVRSSGLFFPMVRAEEIAGL
jgi:uncharacterized protein